jgi:hypothetical protein
MMDTLSTSVNTTQEDISSIPTTRQSKYIRSQTINTGNEPKTAPSKPSIPRKLRGKFSS